MKIYGVFNVSNTDADKFLTDVSDNIRKLQDDGQEVEVQYCTDFAGNATVVYSALILGRK